MFSNVFPECVARVPVSLWGSGGWGCVRSTLRLWSQPSATVCNRLQPSATVRNRPQPSARSPYGRAYGKFCRGGPFWRFQTCRCFVSRGRRGTSWHSDVFWNVSKVVLPGRRNTLLRFQKMFCSFRGRRSTLDVSIVIFRGRRSTLDVSRCVFFANRIGRAASSGDKVQIPWQSWHFVRCAENWRKPRTKHRFWSCKFSGSIRKTRRETSILKLQSVKSGGSLARNARFGASTCLVSRVWFSRGLAVSMGEAAKPLFFEGFQAGCHVVLRGRPGTSWHADVFCNVSKMSKLEEVSHEMLVFLHPRVSSRVSGFPVASPCLWGKLQNLSFSKVSKQVVMSFCVAGVTLCDIPTCVITCRKCQNWRKSRKKCSFFCTHVSRLESLVFLWRRPVYGGSSALHTLHFTLHTPQFAL